MVLASTTGGLRQRRIAGPTGDLIGTAPVARQDVFNAIDRDVVTQHAAKERQLAIAEVRADACGFRYGTVVLHELECSIASASPFGHVPVLALDPSEGGHALLEQRAGDRHPRAVILDLLPRLLLGQTFEAFLTEGASNREKHFDRKLGMGVGEPIVRLAREPPESGRTTHSALLPGKIDEPLSLEDGEVLANSHRGDAQPLGHSRRSLWPLGLEDKQNSFLAGTRSV